MSDGDVERSQMKLVRQLWDLLNRRERWQVGGLGVVMLISALVEVVGVASILPFMQVVSDPAAIHENAWLSRIYDGIGFESAQSFLLASGALLLVIITATNAVRAGAQWLILRFSWAQNHRLSMRLLSTYLAQPYEYFLLNNTAGLNRTLLQEVQSVMGGVLVPALKVLSQGMVALAIMSLLAAVDPVLTVLTSALLGSAYGVIYLQLRKRQQALGKRRVAKNRERFKIAGEALTGIKTLKVLRREPEFLRRFQHPSYAFAMATASNQIVVQLPRYLLETLAFGGVLVILLYYLGMGGEIGAVLPMLSLFAFAAYRMLPTLNQIFHGAVQLRFNQAALDELHGDLVAARPTLHSRLATSRRPIEFHSSFELRNIHYRYPGAGEAGLTDLSLRVENKSSIGLVGSTGAGKTTVVDIILGLLQPQGGQLIIDGRPLKLEEISEWTTLCGYVPQEIFLCDDTIRANIAFGVPGDEIDQSAVERAADIAQIHPFVLGLPHGYGTMVGERGVRLSGGQRQRIGIARALYHDPPFLVLDEATSALDSATEQAVMETIARLGSSKTLVVIAHRLSTVRQCERIYLLEEGRVVADGTYGELANESSAFRALAGL